MPVLAFLLLAGRVVVVVDDLDANCTQVGRWKPSTANGDYWAKGYTWHEKGRGEAITRWTPRPGRERRAVFARWVRGGGEGEGEGATDAPFWIAHADGVSRVRVDMSDGNLSGRWNLLGVFQFSGMGFVMLTNDADGAVVADAVRFAPPPEAEGLTAVGEREELIDAYLDPLQNWRVEGNLDVFHVQSRDGRIHVKTDRNDLSEGGFLWLKKEVPADFTFEFDFTPLSDAGFFLTFFCARGIDGRDIFSPEHEGVEKRRWGRWFQKYTKGRIECYHISYRRGKNKNCRLRRNPGLKALKTEPIEPLGKGVTHRLRLVRRGGRIRLICDGKVCLDHTDPSPLGAGRLGLRQVYEGEGEYSNIRLLSRGD